MAFERLLMHQVLGQELAQVVLTIGVAFILADQILAHYGGRPRFPRAHLALKG